MSDPDAWILAIRRSHERFEALVTPLDDTAVQAPSYAEDWSIAQVASHLGSQAEIFGLILDAGLSGESAPGAEQFQSIWDRWNALPPADQVAESVRANEQFTTRLEQLSAAERAAFGVSMFGTSLDLSALAAMRLGEHAVHTWDIAVALDASAQLAPDAVELLIDTVPATAARSGKATARAHTVMVETSMPERRFTLTTEPAVVLAPEPAASSGQGELRLPAEALVRLVYGRLDPEHTPDDLVGAALLPELRQVFPGF